MGKKDTNNTSGVPLSKKIKCFGLNKCFGLFYQGDVGIRITPSACKNQSCPHRTPCLWNQNCTHKSESQKYELFKSLPGVSDSHNPGEESLALITSRSSVFHRGL